VITDFNNLLGSVRFILFFAALGWRREKLTLPNQTIIFGVCQDRRMRIEMEIYAQVNRVFHYVKKFAQKMSRKNLWDIVFTNFVQNVNNEYKKLF